jgi:uncharacterized membrane protein
VPELWTFGHSQLTKENEHMNLLESTSLPIIALCLIFLGVQMRNQQKKDWKAFLYGGIVMLVAVIIAFIFHLSF